MNVLGINQLGWFCMEDINFVLKGQFASKVRSNIRLRVKPCENKTNVDLTTLPENEVCVSPEKILQLQQMSSINIANLQSFFDQDEFNGSPVKSEINMWYTNFENNQAFCQILEITKNILNTKDSWVSSYFDSQVYEFYSIKPAGNSVGVVKPNIYDQLTIFISNSDQEVYIERQKITILDILSLSGGFANTVLLMTKIFSLIYSVQLFKQMLISRLCWLQHLSKGDKFDFEGNSFIDQTRNDSVYMIVGKASIQETSLSLIQKNRNFKHTDSVINRLTHFFANRQRFSDKSLIFHKLNFKCKKLCRKLDKNPEVMEKQKALDIISQKTNIVKVVESIEYLKTCMRILFQDYQRKIIKQKSKILINIDNPADNKNFKLRRSITKTLSYNELEHYLAKVLNSNKQIDRQIKDSLINLPQIKDNQKIETTKMKLKVKKVNDKTLLEETSQNEIEEDQYNRSSELINKSQIQGLKPQLQKDSEEKQTEKISQLDELDIFTKLVILFHFMILYQRYQKNIQKKLEFQEC
ncbi:UNKNOWN [Stylonychia lemnae]|uniref:Uncharacterized protein n=1 Tax=Stylonychia lemnae TaxID=5949 RepID=A0A078B7M6_STYLE|nr:UNKNOWN [Stylonychia lemnae]|eukprot:CDW89558.1 UNKNOWN [Stylonychia lemnae]